MGTSLASDRDERLGRFLRVHRLLRRVHSGRRFVARVGAPAAAVRTRIGTNVIQLGGYYQLAVRRRDGDALEVGVLHGRRPDLVDAAFVEESARPLLSIEDVHAACTCLQTLTHAEQP